MKSKQSGRMDKKERLKKKKLTSASKTILQDMAERSNKALLLPELSNQWRWSVLTIGKKDTGCYFTSNILHFLAFFFPNMYLLFICFETGLIQAGLEL
jgi:hypothetical protein